MSETKIVAGSIEYLYADIRADRVLNTQAVALSISPTNEPASWLTAQWQGAPGKFRSARVLLSGTESPGRYNVFARITDSPETPIIHVGMLKVV